MESECVGSSLKNDSLTTEGGILSLLSDEADNECKFITIDEWDAKYSSKVDSLVKERINDELDELRKKTFNGNRSLDNISWFDLVDDDIYKEADQTNLQIQSCSVKIEDGEIVIDLSVKSNIELKKNWIVEIGYYNAAGDRKGGCACNMGAIPGLGSDEGEFRGVPNCIDYLKYYRIEHIYS